MKRMPLLTLISTLAASYISLAQAEEISDLLKGEYSGYMALTSNYVWRGVSLTDNGPALQGGVTYTHQTGLYVGLWGSSLSLDNGGHGYLELVPSIGFSDKFANGLGYDLGFTEILYPQADDLNYPEIYASLSYSILEIGIAYSNDIFNTEENGTYYFAAVNYDIPSKYVFNTQGMGVGATVGYYQLGNAAGNSYMDYSVSVSKNITKRVKFTLAWTDTNGKYEAGDWDDAHIVGTASVDL